MDFLPLFHQVGDQSALIVGGGPVAARKAQLLLEAGASVTLLAPELAAASQILVDEARVLWINAVYEARHLQQMDLIVAATNDQQVNHQVAADARQLRLPVNVVNDPTAGTFIFPAVIDRSPVVAAVSSSGAAPVLTRLMRGRIESLLPASMGLLAQLVGQYRKQVQETLSGSTARRRFWERVLNGVIADRAMTGQKEAAGRLLEEELQHFRQGDHGRGEVYLVGAGPGDPDLLTFKALRLMQQADVVLHDRLVSPEILALVRRDAELIYVGKRRSEHAVPQEGINELLIRHARAGKRVCRLKGGDPFIFGRGGEEIEQLAAAGIEFQVVPGITAASGCAAYSGIPLTHRDYSQSVRFVTAHLKNNTSDLKWDELVTAGQTLVFYMGLVALPEIARQLCAHGCSPDMPVALIEQGTTPQHRVFTATLSTICDLVDQHDVQAPTLIIVGEVVKLHHKLNWFKPAVEG
ncbi:uroporphyrinogen-III C-methyltransferase [Natronospirillum operosum]|uniref:Siroheme synthase n=1 Tax=Natronospirillum operosum TaxID=2759953 RepID=A0A4Z0WAJ3_9GAMM|nr:siroheme synthase CysG [Natronospirillum operosum]TGG95669.1 uroporphyrinogen-III C-methyltransferase [Natronospirillum operosum]